MSIKHLLVAMTLSFWIGHSSRAEDFHGRKLDDQPTQFIFGYGSLINASSRNSSIATPVPAIPARIASTFGYLRTWNDRSSSGFTALGLRKAGTGETAMTINGVLYPAEGNDMSAFDSREAGYIRVEVPHQDIEAVSWQAIPTKGKIWVYVPEHDFAPNAQYPLLQSYIDVVIEGGLEYGPDYAREIIQTTIGWSEYWLNDRRLARRPWVFDRQYKREDELLAARAPHFVDRRLPEEFAAHYLGLDTPMSAPAK